MSNRISPEITRRRKTPEQRAAQRELCRLTDEERHPKWYDDPEFVRRKDELLAIIEPQPTEDDLMNNYFAKRPGMKEEALLLMANGATNAEIHKEIGVTTKEPVLYLRKKYGFPSRS